MKKLGRFMKEKREAMGLSLRDASRLSGVSHTHIRDIEDGRSILRPSEIAEMEGMKGSSSVRQLIIRVSDQLKAGEITLIDCTPQEATEAKERLETHRAKRRDRHYRNKEQINAKRREQHAGKSRFA